MKRTAFIELAKGNFDTGLKILEQDSEWQDSLNDLEGPFNLKIPGVSGWGEGLLLASLLKREAASRDRPIRVFAEDERFRSILQQDPFFEVLSDQSREKPRTPLAILRHALVRDLLKRPFFPLGQNLPIATPVRQRPRIGIAWASVDKGITIPEKTVDRDEFLRIFDGIDAEIISFQRGTEIVDPGNRLEQVGVDVGLHEAVDSKETTLFNKVPEAIRQLDCMVTISTTTAHIAASLGIRVELIAAERQGHQWFWQAQANHQSCFYPSVRIHLGNGETGDWWKNCLQPASESLKRFLEPANRLANRT